MTTANYTDAELVIMMQGGSEKAFEQLYTRYSRQLLRKLQFMLKDNDMADEILQEVFFRVWERRIQINTSHPFGAYISRIAQNLVADHYKRIAYAAGAVEELLQRGESNTSSTDYVVRTNEMQRIVDEALDQLSPARRTAFTLCKIEGYSHEQAGQIMQISKHTVHNHLVKAMEIIRRHLEARAVPYLLLTVALGLK